MNTLLQKAKPKLIDYFEASKKKVYKQSEIRRLLIEMENEWNLPSSIKLKILLDFLQSETVLREVKLAFPARPEIRYTWGDVSPYELALSLKDNSFLSHLTASYLNGLTSNEPDNIYVNSEQPRKMPKGVLTQEGINIAFSNSPRLTKSCASYKNKTIWQISSMGEGKDGVIERAHPTYGYLRMTNIERTLIDMAVRPFYSGGVNQVLQAFLIGGSNISIDSMLRMLQAKDYIYPFHQVVGFYLERTGCFSDKQLEVFLHPGLNYDFYLTYRMKETSFSKRWRLYYPAGL